MGAGDVLAGRIDADLRFAADISNMFEKVEARPDREIDGQQVYVLRASRSGEPPVRLYFSKNSGLLVRMVRYVDSPLGRNPTQIDYSDYRDIDGTKVAFRRTVSQPQGKYTLVIDEVHRNVPIEDAKFAEPTATTIPAVQ